MPTLEEINARAKKIWLRNGCPIGLDDAHWLEALSELAGEAIRRDNDLSLFLASQSDPSNESPQAPLPGHEPVLINVLREPAPAAAPPEEVADPIAVIQQPIDAPRDQTDKEAAEAQDEPVPAFVKSHDPQPAVEEETVANDGSGDRVDETLLKLVTAPVVKAPNQSVEEVEPDNDEHQHGETGEAVADIDNEIEAVIEPPGNAGDGEQLSDDTEAKDVDDLVMQMLNDEPEDDDKTFPYNTDVDTSELLARVDQLTARFTSHESEEKTPLKDAAASQDDIDEQVASSQEETDEAVVADDAEDAGEPVLNFDEVPPYEQDEVDESHAQDSPKKKETTHHVPAAASHHEAEAPADEWLSAVSTAMTMADRHRSSDD